MSLFRNITNSLPSAIQVPDMLEPFDYTAEYLPMTDIIKTVDEGGWIAARGTGSVFGGQTQPLVGEWGKTFDEPPENILRFKIAIPTGVTKFVILGMAKLLNLPGPGVIQTLTIVLNRGTPLGNIAQTLLNVSAPTPGVLYNFLETGNLNAPLPEHGLVEMGELVITSTKTNNRGNNVNSQSEYWDGLQAFQLKFLR